MQWNRLPKCSSAASHANAASGKPCRKRRTGAPFDPVDRQFRRMPPGRSIILVSIIRDLQAKVATKYSMTALVHRSHLPEGFDKRSADWQAVALVWRRHLRHTGQPISQLSIPNQGAIDGLITECLHADLECPRGVQARALQRLDRDPRLGVGSRGGDELDKG